MLHPSLSCAQLFRLVSQRKREIMVLKKVRSFFLLPYFTVLISGNAIFFALPLCLFTFEIVVWNLFQMWRVCVRALAIFIAFFLSCSFS